MSANSGQLALEQDRHMILFHNRSLDIEAGLSAAMMY